MIRAILTDIEGTTSSLSFVKDVLFPYSRERMSQFLAEHATDGEVRRELAEVSHLAGKELSTTEAAHQLIEWIDQDRKATPLKALQGMIWAHGYQNGHFHGHVYEDAARILLAWKTTGLALFVFSSGSVHAQKLLFAHTEYGDLTPLFSGYFDTRVGPKQESASYATIARQIGLPAESILFLSDIEGELDAAKEAGLQTVQLVRDGEIPVQNRQVTARNFDEIAI